MTTEQAKKLVEKTEQEIESTHSALCALADRTENEVSNTIDGNVTMKTMLPLIALVVIGIILIMSSHGFLGLVAIACGVYWAYKARESARVTRGEADRLRGYFKNAINNNRKI